MVNRMDLHADYELPSKIKCPFSADSKEYVTSRGSFVITPQMELYELMLPFVLLDNQQPFDY